MKIYVVGIGPGNEEFMTPEARIAIEESDVVVGYTLYVELVKELCEGKIVQSTSMKKEQDCTGLCFAGEDSCFCLQW